MPDSALDSIFKAYDVRGIYPDEIDESIARRIGNAFVGFTGSARVARRPRRPAVVRAAGGRVPEGALIAGADVVDLGLASTDLVLLRRGSLDAPAAMFTASHNPAAVQRHQDVPGRRAPDRRGHRPRRDQGDGRGRARRSAPKTPAAPSAATCCPSSWRTCTRSSTSTHSRRCRVVADTANGVGGLIVPGGVRRVCPSSSTSCSRELDGTFPNHPADPIQVENLKDLQRADPRRRRRRRARVRRRRRPRLPGRRPGGAPVGIDHHRDPGQGILDRHPGETVVHNLICSKAVPEIVIRDGRHAGAHPGRPLASSSK